MSYDGLILAFVEVSTLLFLFLLVLYYVILWSSPPLGWLRDEILQRAVTCGRLSETLRLLEVGANPNRTNLEGYSSLHYAVKTGHSKLIKHLVKYGADLEIVGKVSGYKPLHLIAFGNNEMECLEELLKCGVDLKSTDCMGNTLLHLMVKLHPNKVDIIKKMLVVGMDPHTVDAIGNNCLHLLAQNNFGWVKCIEILAEIFIQEGTDLNCVNRIRSETPLLLACRKGKASLVDLFLRNGAKIDLVDKEGINAFGKVRSLEMDVIYVLIKHSVLRLHRGDNISQFIIQEITSNLQRREFYDQLTRDLENLKKEVSNFNRVSYYDILCHSNRRVVNYLMNAEVRDKVFEYKYLSTCYKSEMKYIIEKVDAFIKNTQMVYTAVDQLFDGRLPHVAVERIVYYLVEDI